MELLAPGRLVYIGEDHRPLTIAETRWKQDLLLLRFAELHDRTAVSELTNMLVYIRSNELPPLVDGGVYYHELIGLQVVEESGQVLGQLADILQTGANDVYVVLDEAGKETLIPDTDEMVLKIDLEAGRIVVAKMEWYGEGE